MQTLMANLYLVRYTLIGQFELSDDVKFQLVSFIRSELSSAFQKDFSFLRQIPSSHVQAAITIIKDNPAFFTPEFLETMASNPGSIPKETRMKVSAMRYEEKNSTAEYSTINTIRSLLEYTLSFPAGSEGSKLPEGVYPLLEEMRPLYANIKTPSAKETRKAFFPKLEIFLKTTANNSGGGCWTFPIICERAIELS